MAGDSLGVDVILNDGEDKSNEDEEGCDLVVESEHETVGDNRVFAEPFHHRFQHRKLIPEIWAHHGFIVWRGGGVTVPSLTAADCSQSSGLTCS